jgi:transcriptional regulator with XRE-family HTH domain
MHMLSIQDLRARMGWSQEELADELGVTQATISNWERGRSRPTIRQFGALAFRFGVSIGSISLPPRSFKHSPTAAASQGE